jgi:hypothetical protein
MPVESPTKIDPVPNMKRAKSSGVAIPQRPRLHSARVSK